MAQDSPFPSDTPFEWSRLKLAVLRNYVAPFITILSSRQIFFVDLMAASGYYDTGEAGSAGLLGEVAAQARAAGRDVQVIAVEQAHDAFTKLRENTAPHCEFVEVLEGTWDLHVTHILHRTRGAFAFFFVDPMGIREIMWRDVRPLAVRQDSEMLVNFASVAAARVAGNVLSASQYRQEYAATLRGVMNGDQRRENAPHARLHEELGEHLARQYAALLEREAAYVTGRSLVREGGYRGRPKYHLIFATRDQSGSAWDVMNHAIYTERERWRERDAEATEVPLFRDAFELNQEAARVPRENEHARHLAESLRSDRTLRGRTMNLEQLFNTAVRSRLGIYGKPLYRRAATSLEEDGWLKKIRGRKWRDEYLMWNSIVQFPQ